MSISKNRCNALLLNTDNIAAKFAQTIFDLRNVHTRLLMALCLPSHQTISGTRLSKEKRANLKLAFCFNLMHMHILLRERNGNTVGIKSFFDTLGYLKMHIPVIIRMGPGPDNQVHR